MTEWIKIIETRLSNKLMCPLKAGLLEYRGGDATQKSMKEISPMFVISANKDAEFSFDIKLTFMSRIAGKIENILEYEDREFKMSDL